MKFLTGAATALSLLISANAFAGGHSNWKSVDEYSQVAFGSIKKNTVGEVHHFSGVAATVDAKGQLNLTIDLSSIETNIDIRNERMGEHVFKNNSATATVTGTLDMDEVANLEVGSMTIAEFEGMLTLAGVELDVDAEMVVARLAEDRVLVSTSDFVMLSTEDLEIDAGIDMLRELAGLSGITRVTPVSVRVLFEK